MPIDDHPADKHAHSEIQYAVSEEPQLTAKDERQQSPSNQHDEDTVQWPTLRVKRVEDFDEDVIDDATD